MCIFAAVMTTTAIIINLIFILCLTSPVVTRSVGLIKADDKPSQKIWIPVIFGLSQGIMALVGYSLSRHWPTNEMRKETGEMKIAVNGMMCAHCEAHVKKALEALDGIESAAASHEENLVTITNSKDVDEAVIRAAVEEAGYEYAGLVG